MCEEEATEVVCLRKRPQRWCVKKRPHNLVCEEKDTGGV